MGPETIGISSVNIIVAGSFGEGISKLFSSDIDLMCTPRDIFCVDETSHVNQPSGLTFQNEYSNTFPGYVRLHIDCDVRDYEMFEPFRVSRGIDTGKHYLNSQLTLQEFQKVRGSGMINGPALTTNLSKEQLSDCESQTVLERPVENDSVHALPFFSATLLEK